MITRTDKPFAFKFLTVGTSLRLELANQSEQTLRSVEILTVFLKDEQTPGGPSQAHIKFDAMERILPSEKSILSHKTWINGKQVNVDRDQLQRLEVITGQSAPYVLDISWTDTEGKTRFQRIPVGH